MVAVLFLCGSLLPPTTSGSDACTVPGSHLTLELALADAECTLIELPAQVLAETPLIVREVSVQGAGPTASTIAGRMAIVGASTSVILSDVAVEPQSSTPGPCSDSALQVSGGARLRATGIAVRHSLSANACLIFRDGFETGATAAWSQSEP